MTLFLRGSTAARADPLMYYLYGERRSSTRQRGSSHDRSANRSLQTIEKPPRRWSVKRTRRKGIRREDSNSPWQSPTAREGGRLTCGGLHDLRHEAGLRRRPHIPPNGQVWSGSGRVLTGQGQTSESVSVLNSTDRGHAHITRFRADGSLGAHISEANSLSWSGFLTNRKRTDP